MLITHKLFFGKWMRVVKIKNFCKKQLLGFNRVLREISSGLLIVEFLT
jgi:hypothetical protein